MMPIPAVQLIGLVRKNPIHGDCMTCKAMSGNGCRINGMMTMTALRQMEVLGKVEKAPSGLNGAVALTTVPGTAVRRIAASATNRATVAATSAFAL